MMGTRNITPASYQETPSFRVSGEGTEVMSSSRHGQATTHTSEPEPMHRDRATGRPLMTVHQGLAQ